MRRNELQFLLEYDAWAMERVLATAEQLNPEAFATEGGPGHAAPHATLLHCVNGLRIWRSWLQGIAPAARPTEAAYPTAADVRRLWREEQAVLQAYVAGLSESDLEEVLENRRPDRVLRAERWQFIIHLALHNMQHRSEVAQALTLVGHSPGELGMTAYLQKQSGAG